VSGPPMRTYVARGVGGVRMMTVAGRKLHEEVHHG
jgi:hypothetical protein